MKPIDSHAHIDDKQFESDLPQVIERIQESLECIVNIGCDYDSSNRALKLANQYDFIYATIGLHPHNAKYYTAEFEEFLRASFKCEKKLVALGEIGLDYYYNYSTREEQIFAFEKQLKIAEELDVPVVVHMRDATKDTIEILGKFSKVRGVLHSYSGSYETAKRLIDRFYFSFSGPITFKNAAPTREVVKVIPLERILIETDSPYLTPVPFRGTRNEPAYVIYVAKMIAEIKAISVEEVINQTVMNTKKIFNIAN
ncbi:MAG: TatD family hydrolase [Fusobacteria bacterium]|nr:TatD family hydrolase [Fusobacteriota bacterium]